MKRTFALGLLTVGFLIPSNATANTTDTCWIDNELLGAADCQSRADADWEGLDGSDQRVILSTGLEGTALDQLVIDYREAVLAKSQLNENYYIQVTAVNNEWSVYLQRIEEDSPMWNCHTMGNKICGPTVLAELPRTL